MMCPVRPSLSRLSLRTKNPARLGVFLLEAYPILKEALLVLGFGFLPHESGGRCSRSSPIALSKPVLCSEETNPKTGFTAGKEGNDLFVWCCFVGRGARENSIGSGAILTLCSPCRDCVSIVELVKAPFHLAS